MDVARERRVPTLRTVLTVIGAVLLIAAGTFAVFSLSRGTDAGVSVERSSVVIDVARRGTLERSISATGTIASEYVRVVAATQPGIVEEVVVKPGSVVSNGAAIARMSNPDLEADVVSAQSAVDVAQAQLVSAQQQARSSALAQQSTYVTAQAQAQEDATKVQSLEGLRRSGFIADQTYRIAAIESTRSNEQLGVARSQIGVDAAQQDAKVAAAQAQLRQAQAQLDAKRTELAALTIRARSSGVVQSVAIDPGARVDAGAELARVADQSDLKAVLSVPEGQIHDVAIGMPVRVDTGNGVAQGRIARVAPSAQNGSVAVDVAFARALPPTVRPDSNVDGTIELETLRDVVSIARPSGAADDTMVSLYKLDPRGGTARLLSVRLGRGSTDRVQVVSGLEPGDSVIVSDTSSYGGKPLLSLH
jgi:multidrug efflux pump subunit AcrA (membrane-fusion protein)